MRAQATLDGAAQQPVTTTALRKFAAKPASGYGSKVAAIAATVCVPWLRGSRLPTARSASWNRRAICSERSQPFRAQNRRQAAFAVLFRNGGRGGIRTHGTLAGTPVFKTGALNHSATLPTVAVSSS